MWDPQEAPKYDTDRLGHTMGRIGTSRGRKPWIPEFGEFLKTRIDPHIRQ